MAKPTDSQLDLRSRRAELIRQEQRRQAKGHDKAAAKISCCRGRRINQRGRS